MGSRGSSRDHSPHLVVEGIAPSDKLEVSKETSSSLSQKPTAADLHQLSVLNEILASKNDNDPRLDTELRHLSPVAKKLIEDRYQQLPSEKRNQRGTIAFLIGRDLSSADDVAFLTQVLKEAPCLSMADCSKETPTNNQATDLIAGAEKMHEETGADVTLHYPQLMVLAQIQAQLDQGPAKELPPGVGELIQAAAHSPVGRVASRAQGLLQNYQNRL